MHGSITNITVSWFWEFWGEDLRILEKHTPSSKPPMNHRIMKLYIYIHIGLYRYRKTYVVPNQKVDMQYVNGQNFKHQSNCLSSLARCKSAWGWDQAFAKDHLTEKNFGLHISRSRPSVRTSNSLILWWSWSPSLRSQPPQIGLRTFPCKKRLHVTTPLWCFFKQRPMESTSSQLEKDHESANPHRGFGWSLKSCTKPQWNH